MINKTLFDIIIPTHERPELLRRALQSLIAQTWQEFHVIIVDDSGKYLPPYLELEQLNGKFTHLIRSGTPGPAESRNMGLRLSNAEYVMFLDDDDIFEPNHLSVLAEFINKSHAELISCNFQIRSEDRSTTPPAMLSNEIFSISGIPQDNVYIRNHIPNSCITYRKDVLTGHWHDHSMQIYEDWDFLLACMEGHTIQHVNTHSVVIHKTPTAEKSNARRGNTRHDLTLEVMLGLYKKYTAPTDSVSMERKNLLSSAGIYTD